MINQKKTGKTIMLNSSAVRWAQSLLVPIVFFLLVIFFVDFRSVLEFSKDEGINLMLGMLTHKGFPMYSSIWNDQPPLFPYVLAGAFELFGYSVGMGRIIILLFSTSMVWAGYEIIRSIWNRSTAVLSVIALILAPRYIILSVAVMFGLPSIAFGLISLFFIIQWHKDKKPIWLVISSLLLALGVFTKLLIGLVAPAFFTGLFIESYLSYKKNRNAYAFWKPLVVWSGSLLLFLASGVLIIGLEYLPQIIDVHAVASDEALYAGPEFTINFHMRSTLPIILLAVLGLVSSFKEKKWAAVYLALWALTAYILLYFHLPVWNHHQLYVTVPLALLAGVGFYYALDYFGSLLRPTGHYRKWTGLIALVILSALIFSPTDRPLFHYTQWPPSLKTVGLSKQINISRTIRVVRQYAPDTNWIVTDRPIYAFMAETPLPPELAVISAKRLKTGYITEQDFIEIIKTYNPEQVLLGRFKFALIDDFLKQDYTLIDQNLGNMRLYVHNNLLAQSGKNTQAHHP